MKTCSKCGETKPVSEFGSNGKGGIRTGCKQCRNEYQRSKAAMRRCRICGEPLPITAFHKNGMGGRRYECKECRMRGRDILLKYNPQHPKRNRCSLCQQPVGKRKVVEPRDTDQGSIEYWPYCLPCWERLQEWRRRGVDVPLLRRAVAEHGPGGSGRVGKKRGAV